MTDVIQVDSSLLVAIGAIAKILNVSICPVQFSTEADEVIAIARASQIRCRRIKLPANWWQKECGALLIFTRADHRPIALLPSHRGYISFDPVTGVRSAVNATVAKALEPHAYLFYPSLPQQAERALTLLKFALQGNGREIAGILGLGILGTMLGILTAEAMAVLVHPIIPDQNASLLWQIGGLLLAIAVGQFAFAIAQNILSLRVESKIDHTLQAAIWDRLLRLSPVFFRQHISGSLLNRVMAVNQIHQKLNGATQRTLLSGIFALLNLGLMWLYCWQLALIAMSLAGIIISITIVSGMRLVHQSRLQQELHSETYGLAVQLIQGVSKLRMAVAEERAFTAWATKYNQQIRVKDSVQKIHDRVSVWNEILPPIATVLMFGIAILLLQDRLTIETFLAFHYAFNVFVQGMTHLSNTLADVGEIVPIWEQVHPILRSQPEFDSTKTDPGMIRGQIRVDQVTFRYPEAQLPVLNTVSLYANPGEFVAIVGASGSGKSTLLRLLLGFEQPQSGTIYYDNQDLAGLDLQSLRRQFGVVLQDGKIGAGTIFDNVTAGAIATFDQVWEAIRMAGLAEEIEQMPMGLHTMISEGGTNLSGGQRQRLLIARSLVSKPKVVLMDEATSALDNRTQAIVTASLAQLNATRILIAHRLSTIRNVDRIYVMEAGQIVQVGTFTELIAQIGAFAQLVDRQQQ